MALRDLAEDVDDVLHPVNQLDVLLLYGVVAEAVQSYAGDRELASKILIPDGPELLKRGSEQTPLFAEELATAVDETFLRQRNDLESLENARGEITETQEKVWQYFYPRKYAEFYYATNHEGEGHHIDSIFYDIDRGRRTSAEDALTVTRRFVEYLESTELADMTDRWVFSWTGSSFHVELLLNEEQPPAFYAERILASRTKKLDTVTDNGVRTVEEEVDVSVISGHEKEPDKISIDPSQTPSGKLNRMPLGSLHMADAETVDGISVPVTREELFEEGVMDLVQSYTPRSIIEDIDELAEKL